MPSLRTLGFASSLTQANAVDFCHCVRIDGGAPMGTKRFTDRAVDVVADIDGAGSQTWTSADVNVSAVDQNGTNYLAVSSLSFANLDYTWTSWAQSPGLRDAPVQVWRVWFDAAGAIAGKYPLYIGSIDNQEHGIRSQLALKPFGAPWGRATPWQTLPMIDPVFAKLMPDRTVTIYWGDKANAPVGT